jgi:hypothetical protein
MQRCARRAAAGRSCSGAWARCAGAVACGSEWDLRHRGGGTRAGEREARLVLCGTAVEQPWALSCTGKLTKATTII